MSKNVCSAAQMNEVLDSSSRSVVVSHHSVSTTVHSISQMLPQTQFYGLLVRNSEYSRIGATVLCPFLPLPLQSVHVTAQVFDFCAEVTLTQTYRNTSSFQLDSEYIFPLDENSAVCGFKAEMNGRTLIGQVKEKDEAKREFNKAKAQGQSTMLLEQKQENIFKISIGNLAEHSECKITLTYITTLDLESKSNRMVIPAVVAPKYTPQEYFRGEKVKDNSSSSSIDTVMSIPRADTIALSNVHAEANQFTMSIELLMPSEIVSITSETHPSAIQATIDALSPMSATQADGKLAVPHHARVQFTGDKSKGLSNLNGKDFVLKITQKVYLEARAVLEVDPQTGSQAVQLAFCPETIDIMDASSLQVEIIFLIDQSGSMAGTAIESVRSCLEIFLKSLPIACRFNLVSFGSRYKQCFTSSQQYSEKSMSEAMNYVSNQVNADLGGTEIYRPLKECLEMNGDVKYPRQIFLLTDGEVTNVQELIDLTRQHARRARLFTVGLGSSVDRHLIKSLAQAGGGAAEFVSGESTPQAKQELNGKIMRSLIRSLQPSLTDVKVDWSELLKKKEEKSSSSSSSTSSILSLEQQYAFLNTPPPSVTQCPSEIAAIFPPNRSIVYALDANVELGGEGEATMTDGEGLQQNKIVNIGVTAHSNRAVVHNNGSSDTQVQGEIKWSVPLSISRTQYGQYIHKLAARAKISEMQNWSTTHVNYNKQKELITQLAVKHGLLSNFTSFIIVDQESGKSLNELMGGFDLRDDDHDAAIQAELVSRLNAGIYNATSWFGNSGGSRGGGGGRGASRGGRGGGGGGGRGARGGGHVGLIAARRTGNLRSTNSDASELDDDEATARSKTSSKLAMYRLDKFACSGNHSSSDDDSEADRHINRSKRSKADKFAFNALKQGSTTATAVAVASAKRKRMRFDEEGNATEEQLSADASPSSPQLTASSTQGADKTARTNVASTSGASSRAQTISGAQEAMEEVPMKMNTDDEDEKAAASMKEKKLQRKQASYEMEDERDDSGNNSSSSSSSFFITLISLATISGAYDLTSQLISLIQKIAKETSQPSKVSSAVKSLSVSSLTALSSTLSLKPQAVATLLALWCFQQCFRGRNQEWVMLAGKARGVLKNKFGVTTQEKLNELTQQIVSV